MTLILSLHPIIAKISKLWSMNANITLHTNRNQMDRDSREEKKKEEGKHRHVGASRWQSRGRRFNASEGREETAEEEQEREPGTLAARLLLRGMRSASASRWRRRRPLVPSCGWSSTGSMDLGPSLNGFLRVLAHPACRAGRFRRWTWAMTRKIVDGPWRCTR